MLGSGYKQTCESESTCNLYVVLVLYKKELEDGKYTVICDYVRIWSPAKSSAEFHHQALKQVLEHLKNKVPELKRLRVWTDGDSSTYKGFPNFGRNVEFTEFFNIEIWHCFFESHHASGVQDSVGKDPRIAMHKAIAFKDCDLYSYVACYVSAIILYQVPISLSNVRILPFRCGVLITCRFHRKVEQGVVTSLRLENMCGGLSQMG